MSKLPVSRTESESLCDLVLRIYRGQLSGIVEVAVTEGRRRLHFVDGDLYFTSDNPLAKAVAPLLARQQGAELRAFMARVAFLFAAWSDDGGAGFIPAESDVADLIGPLPTVMLVMEWAAADDELGLLAALGGEEARVEAAPRREAGAAAAARLLDPHAATLLARLSRPGTIADLLRQSASSRARLVADLARLHAAGLVHVASSKPPPASGRPPTGVAPPPVAPDVLQRFAERVGRDLASRPLVLDADSHRSRLADLLARSGGQTGYELLAVGSSASEAEVHEAYQRLARLAHPHHAARLELAGGDRPLWLLFEQATAAYLALSQPERRRRYDERLAGMPRSAAGRPPSGEERRNLARSYYERAEALIDAEDFHFAIELLKQAVHTHPRPEYYVLLGRAQAKNPNWLRHAFDSYRKAMELGAEDPRISVALGRLCEEMEQFDEARRHYESALARNPAEPDARGGLARLSVRRAGGGDGDGVDKPRSWLGTLLDRIKKGPETRSE